MHTLLIKREIKIMKFDCGILQYYILCISMTNYSYFCPTFLYVFLLYSYFF
jgi:hypothetical protein